MGAAAPENLPASHAVHFDDLAPDDFPAAHDEQLTDRFSLNWPPSQAVHVVAAVATRVWKPAAHSKQASVCALGAYLPASQRSQEVLCMV